MSNKIITQETLEFTQFECYNHKKERGIIMTPIVWIIIMICILAIYFIPTIIAVKKNHLNKVAIVLLNILLGWTFIGWVISLIWSVIKKEANN